MFDGLPIVPLELWHMRGNGRRDGRDGLPVVPYYPHGRSLGVDWSGRRSSERAVLPMLDHAWSARTLEGRGNTARGMAVMAYP